VSKVSVQLEWNGGLKFTGTNARGQAIVLDGDKEAGASPVELLLEALGACAAVDVVVILDKVRTPATKLTVTVEGERHSPEPRYFTDARLRFDVWGADINPDKLARAINLSLSKYCSVYHSLRADLKVQSEFRIHAPETEAGGEYQFVAMITPPGEI
jgi:putative redox protein